MSDYSEGYIYRYPWHKNFQNALVSEIVSWYTGVFSLSGMSRFFFWSTIRKLWLIFSFPLHFFYWWRFLEIGFHYIIKAGLDLKILLPHDSLLKHLTFLKYCIWFVVMNRYRLCWQSFMKLELIVYIWGLQPMNLTIFIKVKLET